MIVFHEGLPRAGKSYEALVRRIIPAIKAGRLVDAYVEGLDHVRIAALAEVTEEECRELLQPLTRDQAADIVKHARDNALVVLDEAQNFWGCREKFGPEMTKFVTEHGHRGMDIVLMGQDLRDVHVLWRRRVELKLCFLKLNALGTGGRYSVTTYKHLGGDKYEKMGTQVCKYEQKFFGTYKSHVSDDTNKSDYKDTRATVWNLPGIKYGMPVAAALAVWGGISAWGFFHPEQPPPVKPAVMAEAVASVAVKAVAATASAPVSPKVNDERSPQERRFDTLGKEHRVRLAGLAQIGARVQGVVEWVDGNTRIVERMTLDQMRDLGVAVAVGDGFVRLALGEWSELATMWPLESEGRVSQARLDLMRPQADAAAPQVGSVGSLGGSRAVPKREDPAAPLEVDRPRPRANVKA